MTDTRRRALGLLALFLLLLSLALVAVWRIRVATESGWAAFSYIPPAPSSRKKSGRKPSVTIGNFVPGRVMIAYPAGPAARAGIKRGDEIVAINGIPSTDLKRLTTLAARTHTGDTLSYTLKRDGKTLTIPVRFQSPLKTPAIVAVLVVNALVASAFLLIGFFVYWRRPTDPRIRIFFIMTIAAAASFVGTALSQIETSNLRGIGTAASALDMGRAAVVIFTTIFFAPLLLHLALIFPVERPVMTKQRSTIFKWIYGFPIYVVVILALFVVAFAALTREVDPAAEKMVAKSLGYTVIAAIAMLSLASIVRVAMRMRQAGWREALITSPIEAMNIFIGLLSAVLVGCGYVVARMQSVSLAIAIAAASIFLFLGLLAAYPVATVVALYRSYKESGVEERRQVKWPLWGTMLAVGTRLLLTAIGVGMSLLLTFKQDFSMSPFLMALPDVVGKTLYTLIPLSFAFAILKYRLMNIDVIIRRTVLYSILTGVVFVLYAVIVASLGTALVKLAGVTNQTMLVASTVVIALVTVPLRNRLQFLVDRNLFRVRRDFPLALRNISDAISTSGAVDVFLRKGVEEVQQAVQNRFVILALRRDSEYVAAAKVGVADEIIGKLRLPVSGFDFRSTTFPEPLRRLGTETIIPLPVGQPPKGFLALGTRLSDEVFSESDIQFIQSAAAQIGLGIENVRLRDEEADFEQARAMQQILLPKSIPQLPGFRIAGLWQPARSVGGDYYDTLALGDTRAGICIADVAGKGMPAALLMANLQAAVKATASFEASPAAVCDRVKNIVSGNLAGGKFISLVYGVLDAASRTFTYCNAGHNPPIVVRSSGEVERLMRGGPAVCRLFRDAIHEEESIELRSGDRLILFTDGVSEARRGEDEFGEERLIELLVASRGDSADGLQTKLLTRLREFTAGEFSDDVTLVVIAVD